MLDELPVQGWERRGIRKRRQAEKRRVEVP